MMISVEIESSMTVACGFAGQKDKTIIKNIEKLLLPEKEYILKYGTCLRILEVYLDGCLIETYAAPLENSIHNTVYPCAIANTHRKLFLHWDCKSPVDVFYPPTDVICKLFITLKRPEKKELRHRMSYEPPQKAEIEKGPASNSSGTSGCPYCGFLVNLSHSSFCPNCGRKLPWNPSETPAQPAWSRPVEMPATGNTGCFGKDGN